MSDAPRYLIAGPAWVGDMVMAQSLFMTIKHREPRARIDVLAPGWSLPLLARMPEIDEAINVPVAHGELGLAKRWQLGRSLRSRHYDHAIVIPRSMKAALIPFFAGAKARTGYRGEMRYGLLNDIRPLDKTILTQTVQRYVALASPAGRELELPPPIPSPRLMVDAENQQRLLDELGLHGEGKVIGLMPGAEYGPAKRWPYYVELAERLLYAGNRVWIFGSEKERAEAEPIAALGAVNLCGRTSLVEAVDLIAACDAVVSNDSGLMHVAAAVGKPLLAIYGSSTPDYTPPLSEQAQVLYRRLDCSPCFKRDCPYGHTDCLKGISVDEVYAALSPILEKENK